ncbi:MAG: cupin domain-containing protein [Acidobacteria bacterium]|nr:cupin domain-containing protein [Acidobacteriota bacterium]
MTKPLESSLPNRPEGLQPARTTDLAGLVDYAPEAIVSRTLVKTGGGSVSIFAFAAGQELSEHTSPFNAVVQVLDGRAQLVIGGETVEASAGEAVLMPADVPHAVRAPERFKMLLVMLRGDTD